MPHVAQLHSLCCSGGGMPTERTKKACCWLCQGTHTPVPSLCCVSWNDQWAQSGGGGGGGQVGRRKEGESRSQQTAQTDEGVGGNGRQRQEWTLRSVAPVAEAAGCWVWTGTGPRSGCAGASHERGHPSPPRLQCTWPGPLDPRCRRCLSWPGPGARAEGRWTESARRWSRRYKGRTGCLEECTRGEGDQGAEKNEVGEASAESEASVKSEASEERN